MAASESYRQRRHSGALGKSRRLLWPRKGIPICVVEARCNLPDMAYIRKGLTDYIAQKLTLCTLSV